MNKKTYEVLTDKGTIYFHLLLRSDMKYVVMPSEGFVHFIASDLHDAKRQIISAFRDGDDDYE